MRSTYGVVQIPNPCGTGVSPVILSANAEDERVGIICSPHANVPLTVLPATKAGVRLVVVSAPNTGGTPVLQRTVGRREFIGSASRFCAAAALAGGGVYLALRQTKADPRDCVKIIPCDDCNQFIRCEFPKAHAARERTDVALAAENDRQAVTPTVSGRSEVGNPSGSAPSLAPSPLYSGERAGVRGGASNGDGLQTVFYVRPLTLTLSPEYRGEGTRLRRFRSDLAFVETRI